MAEKKKNQYYENVKRWRAKAYKQITVNFRYDTDADILQFIDENKTENGVTPLFREAMKGLMEEWSGMEQKEKWVVFKASGEELCRITLAEVFEGEVKATKELLAEEHGIKPSDITTVIE